MKTKAVQKHQPKLRPNYRLGVYILAISIFMVGYTVITAIQYL